MSSGLRAIRDPAVRRCARADLRGSDTAAGPLFSYIDLEKRVREPSAADDPEHCQRGAGSRVGGVRRAACAGRAGIVPAKAAAASAAAAGILFDPLGASVGRMDQVRPPVPLFVDDSPGTSRSAAISAKAPTLPLYIIERKHVASTCIATTRMLMATAKKRGSRRLRRKRSQHFGLFECCAISKTSDR